MTQDEALKVMKTGVNVFLTGAPGTGKTYTINAYIKWLREHGVEPSVTASTGIAATHIGGRTIHSFIGIGVVDYLDEDVIEEIMQRESVYKRLKNSKVLIIDEISMLDAKILDKINSILKAVKRSEKAFGGLQIIFVGDFFQLPPVSKKNEIKKFAFEALSWREAKPLTCYLEDQYRQNEEGLLDLLLSIRADSINSNHIDLLEKRIETTLKLEDATQMTRLYTHNQNVDEINFAKLEELSTKKYIYEMKGTGSKGHIETLKKSCPAPEELLLKVGAKVMFIKNDMEGEYVNGSIGAVVSLSDYKIKVALKSGKIIEVKQADWDFEEEGKVKARLTQYPLKLAWAVTVHKSQGMSLDEAYISLKNTFEYGQGYVALSRVRSVEGLYLQDYNEVSLKVDHKVSQHDKKFKSDSKVIQEKLQKSDPLKLQKIQNNFLKSIGGEVEVITSSVSKTKTSDTKETTRQMFLEGKTIEEISKLRKLKRETILNHIRDFVERGEISQENIEVAFPKYIEIPLKVREVFLRLGLEKLTPVYKALDEKYSFDDLQIYRLILSFSFEKSEQM